MPAIVSRSALLEPDVRVPRVRSAPQERDLDGDLVPILAALRRLDGDGAAALVLPHGDEVRAKLAREMVRRPALFGAPAVRAVLASTPKGVLGRVLGAHVASAAWRCYVVEV